MRGYINIIRQATVSPVYSGLVLGASSLFLAVSRVGAQGVLSDIGPGTGKTSGEVTGSNQLNNPLGKADTLTEFLILVLNALQLIIFPFVVLFLIYGGFKFITAQGNPEKINEAKKIFLWVLVGALLVLGAEVVARAIDATITNLKG